MSIGVKRDVAQKAKLAAAQRPGWLPPVDDPRAEAILLAAFDAFMEQGYDGATMLEIATRAKVSKLTLYALFRDKEGLFEALVAWGSRRYQLDSADIAAEAEADPVAALERYAHAVGRVMMRWQSLALMRIAVGEQQKRPRIAAAHYHVTHAERGETLAILTAALIKAGIIEPGCADEFAGDFLSLLRGPLFYDALTGQAPPPSKAQVASHVRRAVKRLLRAYAPLSNRAERPS